jgi:hypothetical protein
MRNDLTDITLIVDRSGSMASCRDDAEGGINAFIEEQKKVEGDAKFTLVQFDNIYEFVWKGTPIDKVGQYVLYPRGTTALLDAVGRAINEAGSRLNKLDEKDRPGCVIFVIITDGHENASREFTKLGIKNMIEHQQSRYNWQFTFLGADAESFSEAKSLGINTQNIATYNPKDKMGDAYQLTSGKISMSRCAVSKGGSADLSYSDEDRKSIS